MTIYQQIWIVMKYSFRHRRGTREIMTDLRQIGMVTVYSFRQWHRNPRIIITFGLTLVMCFLLSDKAVQFSIAHNTTMQIGEAFIWTFGDSGSILLISLLLILLFTDMPFISSGTPFFLMRINREKWITGQLIYTIAATAIFLFLYCCPPCLCA